MDYEEYYTDYMQNIFAKSEAEKDFYEVVFTEKMCDFLVEHAILENYTITSYKKKTTGIRVDAYDYSEDSGCLYMVITDYSETPNTLTQTNINAAFNRAIKVFKKSLNESFYKSLDESDPGFSFAKDIYDKSGLIRKLQIILLSTSLLSKRVSEIEEKSVNGYQCTFDIWDLGRIKRIEESGKSREDIVIDFTKLYPRGLGCLPAFTGENIYKSYLLTMPGQLVANLYDDYGERLLEQNVRTFLQFRGKVNKGIRNTIINEPTMFFAYNNGITATAEEVKTETKEGLTTIKKVKNFQIVNGGQTTASLFNANKKNKAKLKDVYVQIKLTIIPNEDAEVIVPKISEYANTQNKVSAADFFSNHPFHLRIEEISRRLWAPSAEGSLRETHWYYERVRGQYTNAQTNLTSAKKKEFLLISPRKQMFIKTDLAKFEVSWDRKPHIVSLGAQKNFVKFAETIAKKWAKNEQIFNELYFKELISKAIIFRTVDKFIMKQPWYGGYKANIVTYTVAKLSQDIEKTGMSLDLEQIWNRQCLTPNMVEFLINVSEYVNDVIQDTPEGITNVTEWCKKETCWLNVQKTNFQIPDQIRTELISRRKQQHKVKDAKSVQNIDNGIHAQTHVLEKGPDYWNKILMWSQNNMIFSPFEYSLLQTARQIPVKIPSEKQSIKLIGIEKKAIEEGFAV